MGLLDRSVKEKMNALNWHSIRYFPVNRFAFQDICLYHPSVKLLLNEENWVQIEKLDVIR